MKVFIKNLQKEIIIQENGLSFLEHFARNKIDWMHACGGKGRCTTCKFNVLEGEENISSYSSFEEKLAKQNLVNPSERLACQCHPVDDVTISVPENGKLPHLNYLD